MTIKQKRKNYISFLLVLSLFFVLVIGGWGNSTAFADTKQYTGALTDLSQDSNFNAAVYADNSKDYSIQVIQIAESTDKELFIYTYQPCQKTTYLVANEINMSLSENADGTKLYGLTLLNSDGALCKYKVTDFTVSGDSVRYYNIASILRPWNSNYDNKSDNDNTTNSKAFAVGQLWTAETVDKSVVYSCKNVDVVVIKNLFSASIRYMTGHSFFGKEACDVFFLAFSADRRIDELQEADVDFTCIPYKATLDSDYNNFMGMMPLLFKDEATHETAYLTADGKTDYGGYTWKWIESTADFLKTESGNISSAYKQIIEKEQWVLRYFASEVSLVKIGPILCPTGYSCNGYTTENVSILRLKFVTDVVTYNLGAVSDKVTGSFNPSRPDKSKSAWDKFMDWVKGIMSKIFGVPASSISDAVAVLFIIGCVMLVGFLLMIIIPFLPVILPLIGTAFKYIGKGLWWLLCLPVKGIAALVRKIKGGKDSAE